MSNDESVRVEIYDQAYNLRGSDPQYIKKLADFVDGKMRTVVDRTLPLERWQEGLDAVRRGEAVGRVVLQPARG